MPYLTHTYISYPAEHVNTQKEGLTTPLSSSLDNFGYNNCLVKILGYRDIGITLVAHKVQ